MRSKPSLNPSLPTVRHDPEGYGASPGKVSVQKQLAAQAITQKVTLGTRGTKRNKSLHNREGEEENKAVQNKQFKWVEFQCASFVLAVFLKSD